MYRDRRGDTVDQRVLMSTIGNQDHVEQANFAYFDHDN